MSEDWRGMREGEGEDGIHAAGWGAENANEIDSILNSS
jgi:hypothetical protein